MNLFYSVAKILSLNLADHQIQLNDGYKSIFNLTTVFDGIKLYGDNKTLRNLKSPLS